MSRPTPRGRLKAVAVVLWRLLHSPSTRKGATAYARDKIVPIKPFELMSPPIKDRPKCNIFVTHIANQAGADTPYFWRQKFGIIPLISAPIAKDDWYQEPEANIDLDHPGWNYSGNASDLVGPSPGATCASPNVKGELNTIDNRFGHVGILDYDGAWILYFHWWRTRKREI